MKLLPLITTIGAANAMAHSPGGNHRPQLAITIRDGNFTDFDSLEPIITWENSADMNGVDFRYGIDLSARTTNIAALPRRIWGRATRIFADRFALSTRLEMDVQSMDRIDFEIDGQDEENDLTMRAIGSASHIGKPNGGGRGIFGNSARVSWVEFTKGFDNDGNRVTINPRYNADYQHGDVVVTYDADDTIVKVTASKDDQVVTISQKLNDDNMVSPTLSRDGSLSLEWDRKLDGGNSVRTKLNPNRSIEVEWKDEAWTANVVFPMDSDDLKGATVHIKRDVKF